MVDGPRHPAPPPPGHVHPAPVHAVAVPHEVVPHEAVQRRTLRVLGLGQLAGGLGVASGIAVGGLLAEQVSGSETVAGLATTASVIGAAVLAVPMAAVMTRHGRRPGLALGYVVAVLGALLVVVGAATHSLLFVLAGMTGFGAATAANLQARYAATDLAVDRNRGRSLSIVVWATTVGAIIGPNLAGTTGRWSVALGLPALAGPFAFSAVAFGVAAIVLTLALRPDPLLLARATHAEQTPGAVAAPRLRVRAALALVTATSDGRLGLLAIVVSHAAMVAVMSLTPVHLGHGGASLTVIGLVISLHVASMYAASPLVGWLTDRVGRRPMILLGACLLLLAAGVAGTAGERSSIQVGIGLSLLGLGWSVGLIAGSTLLSESVPAPDRAGVQGATDLVMGLGAGTAGLLAGPAAALVGYAGLNASAALLVVPLVVVAARGGRDRAIVVPAR